MFRALAVAALVICLAGQARAVIFASTGDPGFNTTAPTGAYAGSGWDLQGEWNGFLATPIAPDYFIAANHIGGEVGKSILFQGSSFQTDASFAVDGTDLRLWHVTSTFPTYAPLYRKADETGKEFVVFGTGTQRGEEVLVAGGVRGWKWGLGDWIKRWGTNNVASTLNQANSGALLVANFNQGVSVNEAHLSLGDSSGGAFIKDTDGIWKLAGINFAVEGPYYPSITGEGGFNAALFEETGLFESSNGAYIPATGPGSFYMSGISSKAAAIDAITSVPEPASATALAFAGLITLALRPRRG